MSRSFLEFFSRLWLSALPVQLGRAILIAALFEALVYLINARLRKALAPALALDAHADNAQRIERRRIVLGIPMLLTRAMLYSVAILLILRIFKFRAEQDVYPIVLGVLILLAVGARQVLRDAIGGYTIHLDYLYAVGDEIAVGENSGMVSEITLRTTRLRTRDGQEIIIPNGEVRSFINRTGHRRRSSQPDDAASPSEDSS